VLIALARLAFLYYKIAMPSIAVVRKKRGRPATGQDPVTAIRLSPELRSTIDDWRRKQPDQPSRSEAIRRLAIAMLQILAKDPGEKSARLKKR
jgi:metal-responsive CopG/Arc/MetJ family transcriptional regulator